MQIHSCERLREIEAPIHHIAISTYSKLYWPKESLWHLVLFLKGVRKITLVDNEGHYRHLSVFSLIFTTIPKIFLSFVLAPFIILFNLFLLGLARLKKNNEITPGKEIVFLRTDHFYGMDAGGSYSHLSGVYLSLKKKAYLVNVFTSDDLPFFDKEKLILIRPNDIAGTLPEIPSLASNFNFFKIKSILKGKRLSFIYQRYSLNNFLGVLLSRHFKIPLILEYNGSEVWLSIHWGRGLILRPISKYIEKINLSLADKIIVVSKNQKLELIERGFDKRKILVNPNGVDVEEYNPCINGELIREKYSFFDDEVIIGFIGTFGPWHGVELLIRAFVQAFKEKTEFRAKLLLIGDGDRFEACHLMVKDLDIESKVVFTGVVPQSEGKKYLAACDILTLPIVPNADGSKFFGSPTKLFEYMAMGKAIISSDFAQMGEILEHEEDAYLFEPSNLGDFSKAIKVLVSDASLRAKLGENARKKVVEHYSWDRHVEKILNFIQV